MRDNDADIQTVIDFVAAEGEERVEKRRSESLLLDLPNTVLLLVFEFF